MSSNDKLLPLLIIGGGGHSKVVAEIAKQDGRFVLEGIIDDQAVGTQINGVEVVGNDRSLPLLYAQGCRHVHIAIGSNYTRERLALMVRILGFHVVSLISPRAIVSPSAKIGAGVVVMSGVVINAQTEIGQLSIINTGSSIDHDCKIGNSVHIAPGSTLTGNVVVGDRSFIGAGSTIIPGVTLGNDVVVGAGACVIEDIPAGVCVVGVPAKVKRSP